MYHSDGLLSQGCVLEMAANVGIVGCGILGMGVGGRDKESPVALTTCGHVLSMTSSVVLI